MWPRVVEIMLGLWLILSPFIFHHPDSHPAWWSNDMLCGSLVIVLSLLSFWPPFRLSYLLILLVALWLSISSYVQFQNLGHPDLPPAALQNQFVLGLVLLMLAILPSEADEPPLSWRSVLVEREKRQGP